MNMMMVCSSPADMTETRELQQLSKHFAEMNDSFSQQLQSKEDLLTSTKNDLETLKKRLEQITQGMGTLNSSLKQCLEERNALQAQTERAIQDQQTAERSLEETKQKLDRIEKDLCPQNWILMDKKCLIFDEEQKTWYECLRKCAQTSANILTVRSHDESLKSFLANKGNYWLGMELRWTRSSKELKWPEDYGKYIEQGKSWTVSNGKYDSDYNRNNNMCACEMEILQGKYRYNKHYSY
ncbi:uncharacterized protein [Pyxicephalus adspersus]|uniref:uncharacterized protein isoform X1 n=1 Tax=Pyxicephalus adspersus TaxID=30357 RepID=UPI003B5AC1CA